MPKNISISGDSSLACSSFGHWGQCDINEETVFSAFFNFSFCLCFTVMGHSQFGALPMCAFAPFSFQKYL